MAITYVSFAENDWADPGATPATDTFTIGTRTNGLLVTYLVSADTGGDTVTGITWNSVSMARSSYVEADANYHIYIYFLENPTNGSNTLSIAYSGDSLLMWHQTSWYDGVLQAAAGDDADTNTGATGAPTVVCTPTENNELVVGFYFDKKNQVLTVGAGETEISTYDDGANTYGGSYVVQTALAAQTMDWSDGGPEIWGMVAASYKEAGGGAGRTTLNTDPYGLGIKSGMSRTFKIKQ